MRVFPIVCLAPLLALGQSHPSWWTLASPDATALVGIRWNTIQGSPFADPIGAELTGSLNFPGLEALRRGDMIVSSPELLAVAFGSFDWAALRSEMSRKGMRRAAYREFELWISPGRETLSLARIDDSLVLLGLHKTLESALNRYGEDDRRYSPLLARAARFAQRDVWVVSSRLPDPLASLFVPLDTDTRGFEGGVSIANGLKLDAVVEAGSEEAAAAVAESARESLPDLPQVARGLKITTEAANVVLELAVSRDQFNAGLRKPTPAVAVAVRAAEPVKAAPKPSEPRVIRIFGLDGGPREIVLPSKPEK